MIDLNKTSTWALCQAYVADLDPALLGAETISLIQGWIRARSLKHLASCCELLRPIASQGPEQWRALSQIEAMFKKNTSISAGVDTDGAALANFHLAERMCRITNRRLDHFYSYQERLDPDLRKWIPRAERFIEVVLGDPEEFVKRIPELVRLTSGATATRPRKRSEERV